MIPDYFHFLLTGKKVQEYTNATTTQLVSPASKNWDEELIKELGLPTKIFQRIEMAGYELGELTEAIRQQVGFSCKVVLPATHDTASAVAAVPAREKDFIYISSGTWSLMGTELQEANCSDASRQYNLTNEGGVGYRFRYLKNIMGMWMINCAKAELAPDISYNELCKAAAAEDITSIVDANDNRFLAPVSMSEEVKAACKEQGVQIPVTAAQTAAVIYRSLAACYAATIAELEALLGQTYSGIQIVGGGANATYLNELTRKACKKTVYAGPVEATAIGNVAIQMISAGELRDLEDARACIYDSFPITKYESQ